MPSYVKPAEFAAPFLDRTSEHDSPHGADMDQALRQQTDCLAWKLGPATRTWGWDGAQYFSVYSASATTPYATLTAADTWAKFKFNEGGGGTPYDMGIPWRFTEGCDRILIHCDFVANFNTYLYFRWDSETLLDAVATTTGALDVGGRRARDPMTTVSWQQLTSKTPGRWGRANIYSYIHSPTVPANRRIKLVPYVKAPSSTPQFDVSQSVVVYMVGLAVFDLPPKDIVGM